MRRRCKRVISIILEEGELKITRKIFALDTNKQTNKQEKKIREFNRTLRKCYHDKALLTHDFICLAIVLA